MSAWSVATDWASSVLLNIAVTMDAGYQPGQPLSAAAVVVYVSATGNDTTGTGTVGNPFLTIRKAETKIAEFPISSANVINIGLGTFDFAGFRGINGVEYKGTMVDGSTVTISSISLSGSDITMVVTGATATLNSLVGQYLKHSAGLYSCIRSNTATSGGNTTIVACLNNTNAAATLPLVSSTAIIQASGTFLSGGPSIRGGSVQITDCTPVGGASVLWGTSPTAATTWRRINFAQIGGMNSEGGLVNLETCYMGSLGGSLRGIGRVRGGLLYVKAGCIFSGVNAGANNFFTITRNSTIDWAGPCAMDSMSGFVFENSKSQVTEFPGSWNVIGVGAACTKVIEADVDLKGNSVGSILFLPKMLGSVNGNWLVNARGNAFVKLDSATSVTTLLGTNTTSVDGTNQGASNQDGTTIVGGAIDYRLSSSIQYVSPSGVDTNDGLSAGSPITFTTALARAPKAWGGVNQIMMAAGTYTVASNMNINPGVPVGSAEPLTLVGTAADSGLGTRTSTTISGVVFTDSTLSMTTDQYAGYNLRVTSGAASGTIYNIRSNTATALTVYAASVSAVTGATFVIESPGSVISHAGYKIAGGQICTLNVQFDSTTAAYVTNNAIWYMERTRISGTGTWNIQDGACVRAVPLGLGGGTPSGPGLASVGSASTTILPLAFIWKDGNSTIAVDRNAGIDGSFFLRGTGTLQLQDACHGFWGVVDSTKNVVIQRGSRVRGGSLSSIMSNISGGSKLTVATDAWLSFSNLDVSSSASAGIDITGGSAIFLNTLSGTGNTTYGILITQGGKCQVPSTVPTIVGTTNAFKVGGLAAAAWASLASGAATCDSGVTARNDLLYRL